jgi:hypothetical protein
VEDAWMLLSKYKNKYRKPQLTISTAASRLLVFPTRTYQRTIIQERAWKFGCKTNIFSITESMQQWEISIHVNKSRTTGTIIGGSWHLQNLRHDSSEQGYNQGNNGVGR